MSLWILDPNHVIYLQNLHPNILKHLATVKPTDIAITAITAEEQIRGWLKHMDVRSDRCIWAYQGFKDTLAKLKEVNILNFDANAYQVYLNLKKLLTNKVGTKDLQIAAIALSLNGIVVTSNHKDFSKIPNLQIEDWTIS
jgi:tRNA(fMet)-specific endonuclease VapC